MLDKDQIEGAQEPQNFVMEDKLPRFKINLSQLQVKNLAKREAPRDLAMDEGTGVGLMISSRQKDVVQPKPLKPKKAKRAAKSPIVRIKGLQGGPIVQQ